MKLHEQRNELKTRIELANKGISGLRDYLLSAKFAGEDPFDKYVNRDDVLRWLEQNVLQHLDSEV